jgi:hypothetical protein
VAKRFTYEFEWDPTKARDNLGKHRVAFERNIMRGNRTMKREYDLSKGVRGKFYRKGAELRLPIYLDAKLQEQVERLAEKNGKDVSEMVNQLVRKEVEVIEEFT